MHIAFISVALLFFLGHGLKWVFLKTKVPDVLFLIALGYLVGPVMGVLSLNDFGKLGPFLTTMALVVILYEGGARLRASEILTSSLPAAGLAVLGFGSISTLAALTALLFVKWPLAVLIGLGVGSTSSAVVIPMVQFLSISERTKTILSLESAFTDVLAIVIFLVAVDSIASGNFSAAQLLIGIGPKTVQVVLLGVGFGLLWAFFLKRFRTLETISFAGEAWACLSYGVMELAGFNGAMGVLALGFTLTNLDLLPQWAKPVFSRQPIDRRDLKLLGELTFLLKTFFFIYLGMMIQAFGWQIWLLASLIAFSIFFTRYIAIWVLMGPEEYSRLDAMVMTAMGPRGLACAVLAGLPLQRGIQGGDFVQGALVATIPISVILTCMFVMLSEWSRFRLRMQRLFGRYKEDFGLDQLGLRQKRSEPSVDSEPTEENLANLGLMEEDDTPDHKPRKEPRFEENFSQSTETSHDPAVSLEEEKDEESKGLIPPPPDSSETES